MEITGVKLRNCYQICYVYTNNIFVKKNSLYVVATEHGIDIGHIIKFPKCLRRESIEVKGSLLRKIKEDDLKKLPEIESIERRAFKICRDKSKEKNLDMKLVSVKCLFDKTKLIFYFVAENRIDFRELVRELASIFRTRIEMRQIGVRDEAKLVGGFGPCGRHLCCVHLKDEFEPVSIKMAKEQSLNLNSLKISGMCGRLLCCLGYEFDVYKILNKAMPKIGTEIYSKDKIFTVESVEPLKQELRIRCGDQLINIKRGDLTQEKERLVISENALEINEEENNDEDNEL